MWTQTARRRKRRQKFELNLTSMIDVTFLLLLYFLVTTVLAEPEDRLTPTLQTRSESASGPTSDFQPQIVEVLLADGVPVYRLGLEVFRDIASLKTALERLHKPSGLFVKVYDDPPVAAAAAAIQAGRDVGFEQVTYVPAK
jgi:biopolymer transport protein ExbD